MGPTSTGQTVAGWPDAAVSRTSAPVKSAAPVTCVGPHPILGVRFKVRLGSKILTCLFSFFPDRPVFLQVVVVLLPVPRRFEVVLVAVFLVTTVSVLLRSRSRRRCCCVAVFRPFLCCLWGDQHR